MKKKLGLLIILLGILSLPVMVQAEENSVVMTICESGCEYQNLDQVYDALYSLDPDGTKITDLTLQFGEGHYDGSIYFEGIEKLTVKGAGVGKTMLEAAQIKLMSEQGTFSIEDVAIDFKLRQYNSNYPLSLSGSNINLVNVQFMNIQQLPRDDFGYISLRLSSNAVVNIKDVSIIDSDVSYLFELNMDNSENMSTVDIDGLTTKNTTYQEGIRFANNSDTTMKNKVAVTNADLSASQSCSIVNGADIFLLDSRDVGSILGTPLGFPLTYGDNFISVTNSKLNCVKNLTNSKMPIYVDKSNTWTKYPEKGNNIIEQGSAKVIYEIEEVRSITTKPGEVNQVEDIFRTYPEIAKTLTFTSSDSSIAEIKDGKVLSNKEGVATLTAKPNEFEIFILKVEVIGNPVTTSMQMMIIMLMVVVILATTLVTVYKKKISNKS